MVLWLIGISGAGKTTQGVMLREFFAGLGKKCYVIDGDEVRDFYDNDLGFSRADRVANIKRIMLAAHTLSRSGVVTVVCNIHPFEELRGMARNKIHEYNEVYLKRSLEQCLHNDVKKMYEKESGKTSIVGLNLKFDEPTHSDLILDVDNETEEKSFNKIVKFIKEKYREEFR